MKSTSSYSANVNIFLLQNGEQIEVAGCLEDRFTLRNPRPLQSSHGELVIIIDGKEKRKNIFLKGLLNGSNPEVEFDSL